VVMQKQNSDIFAQARHCVSRNIGMVCVSCKDYNILSLVIVSFG
jgi:hypothetical protein